MNFRQAARRLLAESHEPCCAPDPPSASVSERPWMLERRGDEWVVSNPNGEEVVAGDPHRVTEYLKHTAPKGEVTVSKLRRHRMGLPIKDLEPGHMEG